MFHGCACTVSVCVCVCVFARHHHVINGPSPNADEFSALLFSCLSQLLTGSMKSVFFFFSAHRQTLTNTRTLQPHSGWGNASARRRDKLITHTSFALWQLSTCSRWKNWQFKVTGTSNQSAVALCDVRSVYRICVWACEHTCVCLPCCGVGSRQGVADRCPFFLAMQSITPLVVGTFGWVQMATKNKVLPSFAPRPK